MHLINLKDENFSFWKNLIMVAVFFTVTPLILLTSLFSLVSLSKAEKAEGQIAELSSPIVYSQSGVKVFASLPISFPSISGGPVASDARVELVRQYLDAYNSPLEPFAGELVAAADKYELDFRLLTAIAQQESNLCKIIPHGSFNCWG